MSLVRSDSWEALARFADGLLTEVRRSYGCPYEARHQTNGAAGEACSITNYCIPGSEQPRIFFLTFAPFQLPHIYLCSSRLDTLRPPLNHFPRYGTHPTMPLCRLMISTPLCCFSPPTPQCFEARSRDEAATTTVAKDFLYNMHNAHASGSGDIQVEDNAARRYSLPMISGVWAHELNSVL